MKILIILISGIGNSILFTPALSILRKKFPKARIDCLIRNKSIGAVLEGNKNIDKTYNFSGGIAHKLKTIYKIRKEMYDYSITAFPSNKYEFNLLAFALKAKNRVTHSYGFGKIRTLSFLQNKKIKVDENIHDVEQNLNLLKIFDIDPKKEKIELQFPVSKQDKKFADQFIKNIKKKTIIGIHPGTKEKDIIRRWPKERFIELINKLSNKALILLFSGPAEEKLVNEIYKNVGTKPILVKNSSLKKIAAIIERCSLFLSTDSGLGHIAAARNVKTIAIFGPANYKRTRPYGKHTSVIRKELKCSPCLKYPFKSTSDKLRCSHKKCLTSITADEVLKEINRMLKR